MMIEQIELLLKPYIDAPVECDGMTRIIHSVLSLHKIPHQTFKGYLTYNKQSIFHYWIDLTEHRIDYRAQMWFPNEGVPNGIFRPCEYPQVHYEGILIHLPVLTLSQIKLLFY